MISGVQLALALVRYAREQELGLLAFQCQGCWRPPPLGAYGMAILTLVGDRWLCDPCLGLGPGLEPRIGAETALGGEMGEGGVG